MTTLLWRILVAMGYPEDKAPRYFWDREPRGDGTRIIVTVVIRARGDESDWIGWNFEGKGRTAREGADRAAYIVLQDIMERFPGELANAMPGVFPRGDPYGSIWEQTVASALGGGTSEHLYSDNAAMSAMHAMMKAYRGVERSLGMTSTSLSLAQEEKRQLQRDYDEQIEELQADLAQLTLETDQAIQQKETIGAENLRLTTAH